MPSLAFSGFSIPLRREAAMIAPAVDVARLVEQEGFLR